MSRAGEVLAIIRAPAGAAGSAGEVVENIVARVRALQALAHARGLGPPAGVGIAVPGPLDLVGGHVMTAPHVPAWRSFPLRERLQRALGGRVELENNANAYALGEFWRGAARGRRHVVVLVLGTGVGGAVIVEGRLLHGRMGAAGELGHVCVDPNGPLCDCGARGCLEAYASATGLRRLVAALRPAAAGGAIPPQFLDPAGNFAAARVTAAARAGNSPARRVLEVAGRHLGIAIASFINLFDPELIVVGGGVAGALPLMRGAMMKELRARAMAFTLHPVPIVSGALGQRAGVVGAAYAALHPWRRL